MEIASLLALPDSNLASLQLCLHTLPQAAQPSVAPLSLPWGWNPTSQKVTRRPQSCRPSRPLHVICLLLLPLPLASFNSCALFSCTLEELSHPQVPGCTTLQTFTYSIPFAWILGRGTQRSYTELAFTERCVPETLSELISNRASHVLSHLIFAIILRGWYIKILTLQMRELKPREIKKLSHGPRARKWWS